MLYLTSEPVSLMTVKTGPKHPTLPAIQRLQSYLATVPQVEMTPRHLFSDGMYTRVLPIPAGTVVVGKIHRHGHPVALIKGKATINTDRGMETIEAPHVWVSQPGAKRALITHTDCEFMTSHLNPTNTRDLQEIEDEVIVPETIELSESLALTDDLQRMYA